MNLFLVGLSKKVKNCLGLSGIWSAVHRDVNGNIVDEVVWHNLVTDEGYNHILGVVCHNSGQIHPWYIEPFIDDYTPAETNTYNSPGYTPATDTHYTETGRQEWPEDAPSGTSISNSSAVVITAATTVTFYGMGLVGGGTSITTKGDISGGGVLLSSGRFSTAKTLDAGETLGITYTLQKA